MGEYTFIAIVLLSINCTISLIRLVVELVKL